jgi:ectoine hydroxylase-related dioxygenase (phytanoyl-CoA dioxygenase family)
MPLVSARRLGDNGRQPIRFSGLTHRGLPERRTPLIVIPPGEFARRSLGRADARASVNRELNSPVTEEQIHRYEEDGAICMRSQFDSEWCSRLLQACEHNTFDTTQQRHELSRPGDPGSFHVSRFSGKNATFNNFIKNSPAAELAGRLMRLSEVRFFAEQIFIKEPRTVQRTPWHNDLAYFPLDGAEIASVWLALTPVTLATSGLIYVRGSHKWNKMYRAMVPDQDPAFRDDRLEICPNFDLNTNRAGLEFLTWDMEPGDVVVHHPLVVHGSGKNESTVQRRVSVSSRFFGGNVVWMQERKTGFKAPGALEAGVRSGVKPTDDNVFPVCWRRP